MVSPLPAPGEALPEGLPEVEVDPPRAPAASPVAWIKSGALVGHSPPINEAAILLQILASMGSSNMVCAPVACRQPFCSCTLSDHVSYACPLLAGLQVMRSMTQIMKTMFGIQKGRGVKHDSIVFGAEPVRQRQLDRRGLPW